MQNFSIHRATAAVTAVSLVALAACSDSPTLTRPTQPATARLAKSATGPNSRMLFSSTRNGDFEIYSMNADGSDQKLVTDYPGTDMFGIYSPDGNQIAFTSYRDNPHGDIYVTNTGEYIATRLTNTPGSSQQPSWSKDGKKIVFTSNRDAADPANPTDYDFDLYVMNADGTGTVRLTQNAFTDIDPVWSPDGRQIAFVSGRDHPGAYATDLYVMNADGSQVTRLTTQNGLLTHPSWDSHGRRITFSIDEMSLNTGIYVLDVVSRGLTRLTFGGPYLDAHPSWSPDGTKLAFESKRDGSPQIYSMNADGSGQTKLTTEGGVFVRWSR